jgi:hypothetical protein
MKCNDVGRSVVDVVYLLTLTPGIRVGVTSEDHQPLAAEDEDRQTFQRSGDVALVDVDLVQPQDRLASVLALKPCVTI